VIYLDFAKAFDTVPHERLLIKLASYGVQGSVLQWIKHFLIGRRQRVGVAGSFSTWADVISGVPQGSVLGPILFVCFINDMPEVVRSLIYMYADDSKIFGEVNNSIDGEVMQRDLDSLDKWEYKWQLSFSIEKCKVMHLGGAKNPMLTYKMKTTALQVTTEEKDLGVWMNDSLKSTQHVVQTVKKANQILGLIRRSFTFMDCKLMKQLFTSMVRPHLEYGNVVWHPQLKKDMQLLEGVQHRASRMVPGLSKLCYEDRLRKLDIPSLSYRRLRGDMIEVYKYLHGLYSIDCTDILPLHRASGCTTRGHSYKLAKRICQGQLRANFFGYRVVNVWNSLPEEVVTASSVNCFKGRFDRLYHKMCHREIWDDSEWILGDTGNQ